MTSKREWKRRAKALEASAFPLAAYRAMVELGRVAQQRDRARDCAAALEADCALLAEALAVLIRNVRGTAELERISISEAALAHARALVLPANTSASPTPESIMRDFDALEATGWLGP